MKALSFMRAVSELGLGQGIVRRPAWGAYA